MQLAYSDIISYMSNIPSQDKLDQAMGIGDNIAKLNLKRSGEDDEEKKVRAMERSRTANELKEKLELLKGSVDDTEEYIKGNLKEIIENAMSLVRVAHDEFVNTGDYKVLEAAATIVNAATSAVNALKDLGNDKIKISIAQKELEIKDKKASNQANGIGNTTILVADTNHMLNLIKQSKVKTINVEAEKE